MKDPAFLFYSKDWIEGTAEMYPAEKGIYIDLLCYQHQKGDLPNDIERLARLVRLTTDEFIPIWENIKDKFQLIDNRMVNQKLNQVMSERSEKGIRNFISGTFASLLRLNKLSKKDYDSIRSDFKIDNFIDSDRERITERLTEWFNLRLKSIANANEDVNEDKYIKVVYSKFYDKELLSCNNEKKYLQLVKFLYGENNTGLPFKKILSMPNQLTFDQFNNLLILVNETKVKLTDVLARMENWKTITKNDSIYLTAINWMKRDAKNS